MNPVQLAWKVLRADRRTQVATLLTAAGVAVATALVLLLTSLPFATETRAERALWQEPRYELSTGGPEVDDVRVLELTARGASWIERGDALAAVAGGVGASRAGS